MRVFYFFVLISITLSAQKDLDYQNHYNFDYNIYDTVITDKNRDRDLSLKVFLPERTKEHRLFPLIIFTPSLQCGISDYKYLCESWAEAGYCVLVYKVNREGDEKIEHGTLTYVKALNKYNSEIGRVKDIVFILDELYWNRIEVLRGKADIKKIGAAGHSIGTHSAMAAGGQTFTLNDSLYNFTDERIDAVLGLSVQGPGMFGLKPDSWNGVEVPVMIITGSNDMGVGIHNEADRRWAFENISGVEKFFVDIMFLTKATFSQKEKSGIRKIKRDPSHHQWISEITTAYWDRVLRGKVEPLKWLTSEDIKLNTNFSCKIKYSSGD